MSTYVSFFVRKGNTFIRFNCIPASDPLIKERLCYIPYDKIRPIGLSAIKTIRESNQDRIDNMRVEISRRETTTSILFFTAGGDDSIETKLSTFDEALKNIGNLKKELEKEIRADAYWGFLEDIVSSHEMTEEDVPILWVGAEVGSEVTVEDILEI